MKGGMKTSEGATVTHLTVAPSFKRHPILCPLRIGQRLTQGVVRDEVRGEVAQTPLASCVTEHPRESVSQRSREHARGYLKFRESSRRKAGR